MNYEITRRGYDRLPSVFGFDAFDDIVASLFDLNRCSKLFELPQGYPSDIIEVKNEDGQVTGYEIDVTLAGIPKDNIDITIENDVLIVSINKTEKEKDKNRNYLRKGISQRAMQLRYGLNRIDKDKICANLSDGMLKVVLPLAEEAKPRKITIG